MTTYICANCGDEYHLHDDTEDNFLRCPPCYDHMEEESRQRDACRDRQRNQLAQNGNFKPADLAGFIFGGEEI